MADIKKIILDAYQWRDACKFYDPKRKVSEEDMKFIMNIARLSPSAFGYEPWNFLVFSNFEKLQKVRHIAWGLENSIKGASHIVIILARRKIDIQTGTDYVEYIMNEVQKLPQELLDRRRPLFQKFLAQDLRVNTEREVFDWSCRQTFIPLANMLSAAALMRIDACPVEGFDYAVTEEILANEGLFDPAHFGISCMASFGYRLQEPDHAKSRQEYARIIRHID